MKKKKLLLSVIILIIVAAIVGVYICFFSEPKSISDAIGWKYMHTEEISITDGSTGEIVKVKDKDEMLNLFKNIQILDKWEIDPGSGYGKMITFNRGNDYFHLYPRGDDQIEIGEVMYLIEKDKMMELKEMLKCNNSSSIYENNLEDNSCDVKLEEHGTPKDIVDEMDENFKLYICENMEDGEVFLGYNIKMQDENFWSSKLELSDIEGMELLDDVLEFNVYTSQVKKDGEDYFKIYPSFKWKNNCKINGDSFKITLYPGWYNEGGKYPPNLTLQHYDIEGTLIQTEQINPIDAGELKYEFNISIDSKIKNVLKQKRYEGYSLFLVGNNDEKAKNVFGIQYLQGEDKYKVGMYCFK